MKLKRHRNGRQWEVSIEQKLPDGFRPIVYYHQDTKLFLPMLYLPNNKRKYGEEASSISTAWARLEKMVGDEIDLRSKTETMIRTELSKSGA